MKLHKYFLLFLFLFVVFYKCLFVAYLKNFSHIIYIYIKFEIKIKSISEVNCKCHSHFS